jgi:hypothetical protein
MITTTLNRIREHTPYQEDWQTLLAGLGKTAGDDEPLPFAKILEINGLADALWYCRTEPQYDKEWRLLAVKYARRVEHLNTDPAVKNAIDVSERYANGKATDKELTAASAAAWAAAATATRATEYTAAWAAEVAAWAAANAAADAVARSATYAGWRIWAAERDWQTQEFLRVVTETEARAT